MFKMTEKTLIFGFSFQEPGRCNGGAKGCWSFRVETHELISKQNSQHSIKDLVIWLITMSAR